MDGVGRALFALVGAVAQQRFVQDIGAHEHAPGSADERPRQVAQIAVGILAGRR